MPPNKRAAAYKKAFEERTKGVINYGRVVKALRELFLKYEDEEVLFSAFKRYLAENDVKYLSVEAFARTVGAYMKQEAPKARDEHSD